MRTVKNPPKNLYYKGDLSLLDKPKISIVGTRRPNTYTRSAVAGLAKRCADLGIVVVSGGAMGVDIIAHRAAYPHTIAVFANSLDHLYPKQNKKDIESIYENALALSEHESNHLPKPYDFVLRNRIVTALSPILIIAQADLNSGSLRSFEHARVQGREVFVLPHRLGESEGTHRLLAQGLAKSIEDLDTFFTRFGESKKEKNPYAHLDGLSFEEGYSLLKEQLFELELSGKITIQNGTIKIP